MWTQHKAILVKLCYSHARKVTTSYDNPVIVISPRGMLRISMESMRSHREALGVGAACCKFIAQTRDTTAVVMTLLDRHLAVLFCVDRYPFPDLEGDAGAVGGGNTASDGTALALLVGGPGGGKKSGAPAWVDEDDANLKVRRHL